MKTLTLEAFRALLAAQGVAPLDYALRCPACGTVQSARWLILAGVGDDFESVNRYLGFSCVGRFTGKGSPSAKAEDHDGCNWTLGGLFTIHEVEVMTPDGVAYPRFEPASAAEAQALAGRLLSAAEGKI